MMENNVALANQNLPILCEDGNKLTKEAGLEFARAITKMSLAKNIKLADGTVGVWEECLIEDIQSGIMDFEDFIKATKKVIREPLFNRIDYADIYTLAVDMAKYKTIRFLNRPTEEHEEDKDNCEKSLYKPTELNNMIKTLANKMEAN